MNTVGFSDFHYAYQLFCTDMLVLNRKPNVVIRCEWQTCIEATKVYPNQRLHTGRSSNLKMSIRKEPKRKSPDRATHCDLTASKVYRNPSANAGRPAIKYAEARRRPRSM